MQLNTKYGPIFTEDQTVYPYTKETRMFNLKESNSTGNCVGGSCAANSSSGIKFIPQTKVDNRDGLLKVNNMANFENFTQEDYNTNVGRMLNEQNSPFISNDDRYLDPTNQDVVDNSVPQDFYYNSFQDNRAPTFNQWTRIFDDNCEEENRLKISSKPMKYYVNQINSPQDDQFMEFTVIGNQKQYNVRNEFERAIPTRLNPIYPTPVNPYLTTPFLGASNPSRTYVDTSDSLRISRTNAVREKKSIVGLSEQNFNRFDFVDEKTVQNAGQFGGKLQNMGVRNDGYYDYTGDENHVIMGNGAVPYFGISTRNLLRNFSDLSGC